MPHGEGEVGTDNAGYPLFLVVVVTVVAGGADAGDVAVLVAVVIATRRTLVVNFEEWSGMASRVPLLGSIRGDI